MSHYVSTIGIILYKLRWATAPSQSITLRLQFTILLWIYSKFPTRRKLVFKSSDIFVMIILDELVQVTVSKMCKLWWRGSLVTSMVLRGGEVADRPLMPITGRCRSPVVGDRCCRWPVAVDRPSLPIARRGWSPFAGVGWPFEYFQLFTGGRLFLGRLFQSRGPLLCEVESSGYSLITINIPGFGASQ